MAALDTLIVEVQAQTGNLKSQLNDVAQSIEKVGTAAKVEGTKVSAFGEQMKKGLHTAGLALGMLELVHVLKESTKVAAEDAKTKALLARQLQISTGATKEQTAAVEENLAAMARSAGVLETEIRPAFDKLVRATKSSSDALKLQKIALDASAATGKPLAAVSQALARGFNGQMGALTKLFPELKKSKNAMHDLAAEVKGAADAAANADPYQRLQATMEQLQVTLGEQILPYLSAFTNFLSDNAATIQAFIPYVLALVAGFVAYKTAMMLANGAMAIYEGAMALATIATEGFTLALASTGIGAIAVGVGLLTAAILGLNAAAGQSGGAVSAAANAAGKAARKKAVDAYNAKTGGDGGQAVGLDLQKTIGDKAYNDAVAKIQAKETAAMQAKQAALQDKLNALNVSGATATSPAAAKADPVATYLKATTEKILAVRQKFADAVTKANSDYVATIKAQIDEFRGAFAQATSTDIGSIFANGIQSADELAAALKQRLQSIQQLAQDAASLSAAGYSKTFIEQVISQGPEMGDQMAQALLKGAPEVQKQIQDLFSMTQEASNTGVDQLAYNIQDQFTASTKALTDALDKAATTMSDALDRITTAMGDKLTALGSKVKGHAKDVAAVQSLVDQTKSNGTASAINAYQTATGAPAVAGQSVAPTIQINTTANTNASPMQIAQSTVSAIKFNIPTWLPVGVN
jgi:hypothetical protein